MIKGFCAGSFDPITLGHIDIIKRSAELCDHLTVGVLNNQSKSCMFSLQQRTDMTIEALKDLTNVDVVSFEGHLGNFASENGYNCIIRGLRNNADFDYELQLSQIYDSTNNLETIYLMTKPEYSYISSSVVRENFRLGADVSKMVDKKVLDLMITYYKERN